MKRQLTNFNIVMGIVLAAALIGFAIVVNPFRSQDLSEGLSLPSVRNTTGQRVESGTLGAIDAAKWGPEDLEARYIYSRGYPVPQVQNGFSNASLDAMEEFFSAQGAAEGSSAAPFLPYGVEDYAALPVAPAVEPYLPYGVENYAALPVAAAAGSDEPSLPYWVQQYMEQDEAAAGVEAAEPQLPYWVQQYMDQGNANAAAAAERDVTAWNEQVEAEDWPGSTTHITPFFGRISPATSDVEAVEAADQLQKALEAGQVP